MDALARIENQIDTLTYEIRSNDSRRLRARLRRARILVADAAALLVPMDERGEACVARMVAFVMEGL
jgi:hypothetical protein